MYAFLASLWCAQSLSLCHLTQWLLRSTKVCKGQQQRQDRCVHSQTTAHLNIGCNSFGSSTEFPSHCELKIKPWNQRYSSHASPLYDSLWWGRRGYTYNSSLVRPALRYRLRYPEVHIAIDVVLLQTARVVVRQVVAQYHADVTPHFRPQDKERGVCRQFV
jgi:hypothetical protein